jgi:hypothetical protein
MTTPDDPCRRIRRPKAYALSAMTTLTLGNIANIAEIIGASTIVTGVIFGWIQLRHYRIQQRDAIAQSLMQTFYSRDLANAIALMQNVPDGIRLSELRSRRS